MSEGIPQDTPSASDNDADEQMNDVGRLVKTCLKILYRFDEQYDGMIAEVFNKISEERDEERSVALAESTNKLIVRSCLLEVSGRINICSVFDGFWLDLSSEDSVKRLAAKLRQLLSVPVPGSEEYDRPNPADTHICSLVKNPIWRQTDAETKESLLDIAKMIEENEYIRQYIISLSMM